jgi:hypothetical protein
MMVICKLKMKRNQILQSKEYKLFCKSVDAYAKIHCILLDMSYTMYKDQEQAEKVCGKRGWDIKFLKQLRRFTYKCYRDSGKLKE